MTAFDIGIMVLAAGFAGGSYLWALTARRKLDAERASERAASAR